MKLFASIAKVNVAQRTVEGVIADETPDLSGEIFDYDSSKPHFEKWSSDISKATGGKNLGNVRVMHGNAVAGVTKAMEFDDVAKQIRVSAYIADDNEWNKVQAGCYTGFSIGGSYAKKWDDGDLKRFTAKPTEYSIVDLPCNPGAQFSVIKADGTVEMVKFAPVPMTVEQALAKAGDIEKDKLAKGMYGVSRLADLIQSLAWVQSDAECERACEGDASMVPDDLRAMVQQLGDILIRMVREEVAELTATDATLALAAAAVLQKYQLSEEDAMTEDMKKKHDDAVAALATATTNLEKAASDLQKAQAANAELQKALDAAATQLAEKDELMTKAAERIGEQAGLIAKFEAAPAPLRAALVAVSKSADAVGAPSEVEQVLEADGTVNKAASAIKHALLNPVFTA